MSRTQRCPVGRQGDVDTLVRQNSLITLNLKLDLPSVEQRLDLAAGLAHPLADLRLGRRGQCADLAVGEGEGGSIARMGQTDFFERGQVGG